MTQKEKKKVTNVKQNVQIKKETQYKSIDNYNKTGLYK